jgi:hypothetical protein
MATTKFLWVTLIALIMAISVLAQQGADPNFNATVAQPAYTDTHPIVASW